MKGSTGQESWPLFDPNFIFLALPQKGQYIGLELFFSLEEKETNLVTGIQNVKKKLEKLKKSVKPKFALIFF